MATRNTPQTTNGERVTSSTRDGGRGGWNRPEERMKNRYREEPLSRGFTGVSETSWLPTSLAPSRDVTMIQSRGIAIILPRSYDGRSLKNLPEGQDFPSKRIFSRQFVATPVWSLDFCYYQSEIFGATRIFCNSTLILSNFTFDFHSWEQSFVIPWSQERKIYYENLFQHLSI